ncbi:ABC transporter permease [Streptomyces sp. NPDC005811]|uniref:ABC transporter permease n=1 Tax=Streptomyces sp. NPDC005811 TaxID=3154565 RepID=UPI0033DA4400
MNKSDAPSTDVPRTFRTDDGSDAPGGEPGAAATGGGGLPDRPLLRYVLRRLLAGAATLLAVSFLIFLGTNALPGNVAEASLGRNPDPARLAELEQRLGLDRPLLVRYADWLGDAARGHLGDSAAQLAHGAKSAPISDIIGTPLWNSLVLGGIAAVLLLPLALLVGTAAALRAGRLTDHLLSFGALCLGALPEFVLGTFLIALLFNQLDLLPPVSLVPPGSSPLARPSALVMPVLTLLCATLAFCARQIRAGVIESLKQDYVRMARLNGIGERRVIVRYALRNSLASSVQTYAQAVQYLLGGIIVVEALFGYPGIGNVLVHAVQVRDIPMVQAIALALAALYILINVLADIVVVLLVPRLRTEWT